MGINIFFWDCTSKRMYFISEIASRRTYTKTGKIICRCKLHIQWNKTKINNSAYYKMN